MGQLHATNLTSPSKFDKKIWYTNRVDYKLWLNKLNPTPTYAWHASRKIPSRARQVQTLIMGPPIIKVAGFFLKMWW